MNNILFRVTLLIGFGIGPAGVASAEKVLRTPSTTPIRTEWSLSTDRSTIAQDKAVQASFFGGRKALEETLKSNSFEGRTKDPAAARKDFKRRIEEHDKCSSYLSSHPDVLAWLSEPSGTVAYEIDRKNRILFRDFRDERDFSYIGDLMKEEPTLGLIYANRSPRTRKLIKGRNVTRAGGPYENPISWKVAGEYIETHLRETGLEMGYLDTAWDKSGSITSKPLEDGTILTRIRMKGADGKAYWEGIVDPSHGNALLSMECRVNDVLVEKFEYEGWHELQPGFWIRKEVVHTKFDLETGLPTVTEILSLTSTTPLSDSFTWDMPAAPSPPMEYVTSEDAR